MVRYGTVGTVRYGTERCRTLRNAAESCTVQYVDEGCGTVQNNAVQPGRLREHLYLQDALFQVMGDNIIVGQFKSQEGQSSCHHRQRHRGNIIHYLRIC